MRKKESTRGKGAFILSAFLYALFSKTGETGAELPVNTVYPKIY